MNTAVMLLDLRIRRVATLLWWLAVVLIVLMYMAIYPTIRDTPGVDEFVANLPEAFREAFAAGDYTTPVGYLESEVFSGLIPVVILVLTIGRGAFAVGGEEELGRLGVVMALPVRRRQVYLAKFGSVAAATALVVFGGVMVTVLVLGPPFGIDIAIRDVAATCLQLYLFVLLAGAMALAAGAATGRRGAGVAAPAGIFALGFLVDTLGRSVDWLERLRPFEPWRWYNDNAPLSNGLGVRESLVLIGATVLVTIIGALLFDRRDLRA